MLLLCALNQTGEEFQNDFMKEKGEQQKVEGAVEIVVEK